MTTTTDWRSIEGRIARASIPIPPIAEVTLSTGRIARCGIHTAQPIGDDVTDAEREEAWGFTNRRCARFDRRRDEAERQALEAYDATGIPALYNAWKEQQA